MLYLVIDKILEVIRRDRSLATRDLLIERYGIKAIERVEELILNNKHKLHMPLRIQMI